jgi:hypothetical protein
MALTHLIGSKKMVKGLVSSATDALLSLAVDLLPTVTYS